MSVEASAKPKTRISWEALRAKTFPRVRDFFVHVLGQVRILRKAYPGLMHALLFWGVTIQVIGTAINLMQMQLFTPFALTDFPRQGWYLAYELTMDLAGVAILLGVLLAAFRRYVLRPKTLETRWDDSYALAMLFGIALVGFTNEGLRLLVTKPAWAAWSPVGNWVAGLLAAAGVSPQGAVVWHDPLVYLHVGLVLTLVASIPFTKLRHLVNTPLNILTRRLRQTGTLEKIEEIETTELLGAGKITEFTDRKSVV